MHKCNLSCIATTYWRYKCKDISRCILIWKYVCGLRMQFPDRLNPLSANPTKWSNTLKQFVGKLPTNCLSVFDHFVKLALKGLIWNVPMWLTNAYNKFNIMRVCLATFDCVKKGEKKTWKRTFSLNWDNKRRRQCNEFLSVNTSNNMIWCILLGSIEINDNIVTKRTNLKLSIWWTL